MVVDLPVQDRIHKEAAGQHKVLTRSLSVQGSEHLEGGLLDDALDRGHYVVVSLRGCRAGSNGFTELCAKLPGKVTRREKHVVLEVTEIHLERQPFHRDQ